MHRQGKDGKKFPSASSAGTEESQLGRNEKAMHNLNAKMMAETHIMSQDGMPNQIKYGYDEETNEICGDDERFVSVQTWIFNESQILIFLGRQPGITMKVLVNMWVNDEFCTDEVGFYDRFYPLMHKELSDAGKNCN